MSRLACLLALWGGFAVGCTTSVTPNAHHHDDADALHTCPMHPEIVRHGPGSCPICGMDLVVQDVQAESATGSIHLDAGIRQSIGVRTARVQRGTLSRSLRTLGQVEVGEDELSVVNLRFSGWVERMDVDRTGEEVAAGDPLFAIYSPELVAAQEQYLLALATQGPDAPLTQSASDKLVRWGLSTRDLERLQTKGEASRTTVIRAPRSGFILAKSVVAGARVEAGADLYRIGNLQRIWVTADVYEHDVPWVTVGQKAELELTHSDGPQVADGEVAYVYPTLDPRTRTLKIRLEFDNPGVKLKPGMLATVHVQARQRQDVITVPNSAVLHDDRRTFVFVAHSGGRFEPRTVRTGLQGDDRRIEVLTGLEEGEEVVVSGQFLLDADSQLQEALHKLQHHHMDHQP
ncbi:MAG: efflux RND transporter periplasmic adaptor subunit [Myxococcota bacterium]